MYEHIKYRLLKMLKIKRDINPQDLIDFHPLFWRGACKREWVEVELWSFWYVM